MRPPEYQRPFDIRSARRFFLRFGVVVIALIAAFQSISFYVESLWFASLGFEPVYWYRLKAEATVFLIFAVVSAVVLWLLFRLVMPPGGYSRRPFLQFGQESIVIPTAETLKRLASPAAAVVGVFFGLSFSSDWNTYALFINSVPTSSMSDPIFGLPISFYLFTLPVLGSVVVWFFAIGVISILLTIFLSYTVMTARFMCASISLG